MVDGIDDYQMMIPLKSMLRCGPRLSILFAAFALTLGGCAEIALFTHATKEMARTNNPSDILGAYKVGDPYQIEGVWYYPTENPGYAETGIASWYGEPFHGQRTANGAIYDMNALTAAHRTLPMPTKVRVTNLDNGRSLVLILNDRGPYARGRIIDVSRRAAQLLGFYAKGTALVRGEAIGRLFLAMVSTHRALRLDPPYDSGSTAGAVLTPRYRPVSGADSAGSDIRSPGSRRVRSTPAEAP